MSLPRSAMQVSPRPSLRKATGAASVSLIRPALWAGLSLASILAAAALSWQLASVWTILLTLVWSLYDPYLFAVLFFPALIPFGNVQISEGISFTILRAVVIIVALGCLLKSRRLIKGIKAIPLYLWLGLAGLLLAYVLSLLANDLPADAFERVGVQLMRIVQVIVIFVSVYQLPDGRMALLGLTLAGVSVLMTGTYLGITTDSWMTARSTFEPIGSLFGMTLKVTNTGAFVVMSGLAAMTLAGMTTNRMRRSLLLILGTAILFASLASGRREALVAIVLAFVLIPFVSGQFRRGILLGGIVATTAVLAYWAGPLREFLEQRESIASEFTGGGTGRMPLLQRSLELWSESPVFGYGPGTHSDILRVNSDLGEGGVAAHNSFTGSLVEAGVLGGLAVVILALGFIRDWIRCVLAARRHAIPGWPSLMLASAASIFTIMIVGDFVNHSGYMLLFGLLSAWMVRTLEEARR